MIIPVRCFTCNNLIGDKYTLYKKLMNYKDECCDGYTFNVINEHLRDYGDAAIKKDIDSIDDYKDYKRYQLNELFKKQNKMGFETIVLEVGDDSKFQLVYNPGKHSKQKDKVDIIANMVIFIILDFENYCCNRHFISHIPLIKEIN